MSSSSQNPGATPNPAFKEITDELVMPSAWQAMFDEAREHLAETQPDGFEVEDVGRLAWSWMPETEKARARDILFYTYWAAQLSDEEELERYEREKEDRLERRYLLGRYEELADGSRPVPYALLADIVRLTYQLNGGGER